MTPTPQAPASSIDEGVAAALGRIPSGLFVVSWKSAATDRAMLASWVMQAGFVPPLVSVAVGAARDLLTAVRSGGSFAVTVLADTQRSLLARFGKPTAEGEDPFAGLAVVRTPAGLAVLADAAGWLECRPVAESSAADADHVVVLGRVMAAGGVVETPPAVHVRRNGLKY